MTIEDTDQDREVMCDVRGCITPPLDIPNALRRAADEEVREWAKGQGWAPVMPEGDICPRCQEIVPRAFDRLVGVS